MPTFVFIYFPTSLFFAQRFFDNPKYHNNRVKFCKENPNIIHSISNAFLIKGNLFFRINRSGLSPGSPSYIYNLKSGKLIDVTRVVPDAGNGYLPIAADKIQTTDFENSNFLASDGESVFTAYSSQFMFSVKKATVGKSPKYDSVLKQYFTTGNSKSNPVIVQVKPKEFF
ncbi:hypothetical protein KRR40_00365 [Niabella defluvii]|nr:hypothetical protein KRR40_00365 [Niabella sp. I65]